MTWEFLMLQLLCVLLFTLVGTTLGITPARLIMDAGGVGPVWQRDLQLQPPSPGHVLSSRRRCPMAALIPAS
jgi:hypothetical protein